MNDYPILDAHIHLWDPVETPRASSAFVRLLGKHPRLMKAIAMRVVPRVKTDFLGDPRYVLAPFLPEHYRDELGPVATRIAGYVHVEAGYEGRGPTGAAGETSWLDALHSPPAGIVGAATLDDPALPKLLDAHLGASARFRGVRDKLAISSSRGVLDWAKRGGRSRSRAFRRGYALLGERGLSFDAFVYADQLLELAELVEAHPETDVVLCHVGTPPGLGGPYGGVGASAESRREIETRWRAGLERLAASEHVHIKLSGMTMPVVGFGFHRASEPPTSSQLVERVGPHWRFALDLFGAGRCLFGSNFPMDAVSVRYPDLVEAFEEVIADLPASERRAVMHDNAVRFYRLSV